VSHLMGVMDASVNLEQWAAQALDGVVCDDADVMPLCEAGSRMVDRFARFVRRPLTRDDHRAINEAVCAEWNRRATVGAAERAETKRRRGEWLSDHQGAA
jgi:hypothetical protein